jgi:IS5 family transposase
VLADEMRLLRAEEGLGGKLEILLAESLRVAHESGALRTKDLARVTVDTTVQPTHITFPTDAASI